MTDLEVIKQAYNCCLTKTLKCSKCPFDDNRTCCAIVQTSIYKILFEQNGLWDKLMEIEKGKDKE